MKFDVDAHLAVVERSVSSLERDAQPARAVTLSRSYATSVEDLWDAVTNPERIPRWFLPIGGDLSLGGRYQLEGNAGGLITACERLSHFALTWEFGGDVSWLEVRFSANEAEHTRLKLTHNLSAVGTLGRVWSRRSRSRLGVGHDGTRDSLGATERAKARRRSLSPLHRTARRSSQAVAKDGRARRSRLEPTRRLRMRRHGARPRSTQANQSNPSNYGCYPSFTVR